MLNQLRNLTKTWIAAAFIALLVASFAVWGVADIFTGRTPDAVLVVGKDQISVARFSLEFERELARISQQSDTPIDRNVAVQLGLDRNVLSRLALRSAMEQKTRALQLSVSPAALARELREIEAFIDPITGRFDQDTYLTYLRQVGITPAQFEADMRLDLLQGQLGVVFGSGVRPPQALAAVRQRFASETRALSAVIVPAAAAPTLAQPTETELQAFYEERAPAYAIPARRAFSFVTLAIDDFVGDVDVDEELVREMYEQRQDALRTPDRRDVVEIAAPDEATASEAALRLRAGEEPDAVATDLGLAPPNRYDDALPASLLTRALADAAFLLDEGEVSDPVDGGIAWFVARVDEVLPGETQTFEQALPELELEVARDVAGERLFDAIDAFELAKSRGSSLAEAASSAQVPVFSYAPVDATGAYDGGIRPEQLVLYPELVRAAFVQPVAGVTGELEELGDAGYFVLRVDEIVPTTTRPLAEVEEEVRAQFDLVRRSEALDGLAETARARLAEGASPSDAATAASALARGEVSELRRGQTTPTLPGDVLSRAFAARVGDVIVGASPDGGRLLLRVDAIRPAVMSEPEVVEQLRARLEQEVLNDLSQLYLQALQQSYPVSADEQLLAQATGVAAAP
jgi:peptidyl-prolyl cis-trans isomerase D